MYVLTAYSTAYSLRTDLIVRSFCCPTFRGCRVLVYEMASANMPHKRCRLLTAPKPARLFTTSFSVVRGVRSFDRSLAASPRLGQSGRCCVVQIDPQATTLVSACSVGGRRTCVRWRFVDEFHRVATNYYMMAARDLTRRELSDNRQIFVYCRSWLSLFFGRTRTRVRLRNPVWTNQQGNSTRVRVRCPAARTAPTTLRSRRTATL